MGLLTRVRLELARMLRSNFGSVQTNNGELLYDGDEIKEGDEVFLEDEEGELQIPADGEYETETEILVVTEGVVSEIKEKDEAGAEKETGAKKGSKKNSKKPVSREEFNDLLSLVSKMAKEQKENNSMLGQLTADFQKFRKMPVSGSANQRVKIKDKTNLTAEELFCQAGLDG